MEYVGSKDDLHRGDRGRVEGLLLERILARKVKEFEWADDIRRQLDAHGVTVMDRTVGLHGTSEGVQWYFSR